MLPTQRLNSYYQKNEQKLAIGFFVGGFILDMLMLDQIDSLMTIGPQLLYLLIIWAALVQMFFEESHPVPNTSEMFVLKRWYYEYRTALVHFLFGALLNGYTLFFFKSSSLIVSFVFMAVMIVLLIANESHRFKKMGLSFKFGLLSLCFLCFSAYVTPIAAGSIGTLVFLLSVLLGSLPLVLLGWWIQRKTPELFERTKRQVLVPMASVLLVFLALYLAKLIPPVPLSIPFIGVYHSVEKVADGYKLGHERPWWRFWHNGDQEFHAQRADRIFVFFRIFSPTRFSDQVTLKWYWNDNQLGWVVQDSIPIKIVGGRAEGFRGFGVKSNYQPGDWKAQVETTDGREIGRVYFTVDIAPSELRTLEYITM